MKLSGFPRLLENSRKSRIFSIKFPGPGRSWKMSFVLESPGNLSLRSWEVLKFTCGSNYTIIIAEFGPHPRSFIAVKVEQKLLASWALPQTHMGKLTALPRPSSWWEAVNCSLPKNLPHFSHWPWLSWIVVPHCIFWVSNWCLSLHLNTAVLWQLPGKRSWGPGKVLEFLGSKGVGTLIVVLRYHWSICCSAFVDACVGSR